MVIASGATCPPLQIVCCVGNLIGVNPTDLGLQLAGSPANRTVRHNCGSVDYCELSLTKLYIVPRTGKSCTAN